MTDEELYKQTARFYYSLCEMERKEHGLFAFALTNVLMTIMRRRLDRLRKIANPY